MATPKKVFTIYITNNPLSNRIIMDITSIKPNFIRYFDVQFKNIKLPVHLAEAKSKGITRVPAIVAGRKCYVGLSVIAFIKDACQAYMRKAIQHAKKTGSTAPVDMDSEMRSMASGLSLDDEESKGDDIMSRVAAFEKEREAFSKSKTFKYQHTSEADGKMAEKDSMVGTPIGGAGQIKNPEQLLHMPELSSRPMAGSIMAQTGIADGGDEYIKLNS